MVQRIVFGFSLWSACVLHACGQAALQFAQVSTPEELQEHVRRGTTHIVITEHLNMMNTPRFSETTQADDSMIAVVFADNGAWTQTIRGNCTEEPTEALDPPRQSSTQCLIQIREDFLELPLEGSKLWLSDLYVKLLGVEKRHSTLLSAHQGDMYITRSTFVGDEIRTRAIDVKEGRKMYISDCFFAGFQKDRDGVMRLEAGSLTTVRSSTFSRNTVSPTEKQPDIVAAGPVAGLKSDASVWFQSCAFEASNVGADTSPQAVISVESQDCHVYSNTFSPAVWDLDISAEITPWLLTHRKDEVVDGEDVFQGREFPTEGDAFFAEATVSQAEATGLPAITPRTMPHGTSFITQKPSVHRTETQKFWTTRNIVEITLVAAILTVVGIGFIVLWRVRTARRAGDSERIYAALAAGSTMPPPEKVPPGPLPSNPGEDAKLRFLHEQLNSFGPSDLLLGYYQLLGGDNRYEGGQALVQLALRSDRDALQPYALKFFLQRPLYNEEASIYQNAPPVVRSFMPDVVQYAPNEDLTVTDPFGNPLPPFIVMENTEPLSDRLHVLPTDILSVAEVLGHISGRIADLHEAGYAHRDLKPACILWQPRTCTWVVSGFSMAAPIGEAAAVGCSITYAPPETVSAFKSGTQTMIVDPSVDAWALGVIAFELLLRRPAFGAYRGSDQIASELTESGLLPWDEGRITSSDREKLGVLYDMLLKILNPDPSQRATVLDFHMEIRRLFAGGA